jgi:hypothetical protein
MTTTTSEDNDNDEKKNDAEALTSDNNEVEDTTAGGEKRPSPSDNTSKSLQKKAKIAMPPSVEASLLDVEKYELDPTPEGSSDEGKKEDDETIANKITTPSLMLFGLHPLVKESPLQKLCETYGTVKDMSVRSAFASRYGHVEFETVEQARTCYKALNGAKLLHKAILVQPGSSSGGGGSAAAAATESKDAS